MTIRYMSEILVLRRAHVDNMIQFRESQFREFESALEGDTPKRRGLRVDSLPKEETAETRRVKESHITVSRNSEEDAKDRHIIVKLDDKEFAMLGYGKSATATVTPGRHSLRVENTWNKQTIEFTLAPGEHAKFRTVNRESRMTWVLSAFGGGPLHCSIEREY
jgi:hypothetical protein